jgi:hypothetical protein
MKQFAFLAILAVIVLCRAEQGSGTSPEGPLDIHPRETKPPKLGFSASLTDANNNSIFQGNDKLTLNVQVTNSGDGPALGVSVVLSGGTSLVSRFGTQQILGDIPAGRSQSWTPEITLPTLVPAEDGETLFVQVKESRPEWSCPDRKWFSVAIQPATGKDIGERKYVDVDIVPERRFTDPNAFGIVVGITKYRDEGVPEVTYGRKDAEKVLDYFQNVCGVPPANTHKLLDENATRDDIEELFGKTVPSQVNANSTVYIYFAGHGTPRKDGQPDLLPWNGTPGSDKVYPVSKLVEQARTWNAKRTVVMLDACFAGSKRVVYESGARPGVRPDFDEIGANDKCVVLTASGANETAHDLPDANHGLFTYFLLKGLKGEAADANGNVTLKSLYAYVSANVPNEAKTLTNGNDSQVPALLPAQAEQTVGSLVIGRGR